VAKLPEPPLGFMCGWACIRDAPDFAKSKSARTQRIRSTKQATNKVAALIDLIIESLQINGVLCYVRYRHNGQQTCWREERTIE
jgi:hypothetical protein